MCTEEDAKKAGGQLVEVSTGGAYNPESGAGWAPELAEGAGGVWDDLTGKTAAEEAAGALEESSKQASSDVRAALAASEKRWAEFQEFAQKELGLAKEEISSATEEQKRMFEEYLNIATGEFDKYYQEAEQIVGAGKDEAIRRYQQLIDTGAPFVKTAGEAFTRALEIPTTVSPEEFQQDPYYNFLQQEAQRSVESSAAARGTRFGGGTLKELQDRAMQVASGYRSQKVQENLAAIGALTGVGSAAGAIGMPAVSAGITGQAGAEQTATQQMLQALGFTTAGKTGAQQYATGGQALATGQYADLMAALTGQGISAYGAAAGGATQAGMSAASQLANLAMQGGQARASAYMGAQQGQMNTLLGLGQIAVLASDERLKENVELVGTNELGLNEYEFSYLGEDVRYRGVMAQEVLKQFPDAVITMDNGYYAVDYGKLGIKMERVH